MHAPDLQPAAAGLAATTLRDYIAQCERELDRFDTAPVVIGASLGGLLALQLAASGRVRAAVLLNPLPPAPEAAGLPCSNDTADVVAWRSAGRLGSTRRALPDSDDAARLYAFRRWRDESGAVLAVARAGVDVAPPCCPLLVVASEQDDAVPIGVSVALAQRLSASLLRVPGSHVGPLLGTSAACVVKAVSAWLGRFL